MNVDASDPMILSNPYRPGAGHRPPYLAGRQAERDEFQKLLKQRVVLENLVLTGLRGVGKTVLLEDLKPIARSAGWLWVGTDLSESSSLTEEKICTRLMTDLAAALAGVSIGQVARDEIGFVGGPAEKVPVHITYEMLVGTFNATPGLPSDRLRRVLELVSDALKHVAISGIVFAYDEAQTLADHADKDEFPLSLLLDVFQSIQRAEWEVPMLLVLTGLPTLFPKLVEARTYAERMFRVLFLDSLTEAECRKAITKPVDDSPCPFGFTDESVEGIWDHSAGYPYFVQFICREVFDIWVGQHNRGEHLGDVEYEPMLRKLDDDFFAGRWNRATDRQRDLLEVIALLDNSNSEFSVQDIVEAAKLRLAKPFSPSHVNQMLAALTNSGLIYKNRHGRYSLAVPLLDQFIRRQLDQRI